MRIGSHVALQVTEESLVVSVLSCSWRRVVELQRNRLFRAALTSFVPLAFHEVFLCCSSDSAVSTFQLQVTFHSGV